MRNCDSVLKMINDNIEMFERYPETEHTLSTLKSLRKQRNQIMDLQAGKLTYMEMDYSTREWFTEMPSWGTYGT